MIVLPMRRVRRQLRRVAGRAARLGRRRLARGTVLAAGLQLRLGAVRRRRVSAGEIPNGGLGRYTSIAGDDDRVIVATYDQGLGDLVAVDVTDPASPKYVVVDGIPDVTPTYDPGTYRGGIEDAGGNVGTWTSSRCRTTREDRVPGSRQHGAQVRVREEARAVASYIVDPSNGEDIGSHTSIVIDGSNHPAIAYLAVGNDDGMGGRFTELRLARAAVVNPGGPNDWTISTIVGGAGTCAGLCSTGTVCVAGAAAADPQRCVATTSDCTATCGDGTACVTGTCADIFEKPDTAQLATGTGLFVNLLLLPDGRLAAVYYDRNNRALALALENAVDANAFTETVLDAVTPGDRGMWASAVVDGSGAIHVAYQDAIGDQLMYTQWSGAVATPRSSTTASAPAIARTTSARPRRSTSPAARR